MGVWSFLVFLLLYAKEINDILFYCKLEAKKIIGSGLSFVYNRTNIILLYDCDCRSKKQSLIVVLLVSEKEPTVILFFVFELKCIQLFERNPHRYCDCFVHL